MNRITFPLLLCALCCASSSLAFVYEDCGSEIGKFDEVWISSCENFQAEEKCVMTRGSEIHVHITFTPKEDVSYIIMKPFVVFGKVSLPLTPKNPEVCMDPNSGIVCPLKKNQTVVYKRSFVADPSSPPISFKAEWHFLNDKEENIICLRFPAKLK